MASRAVAWTHFWLNEGFATFMADAYKEHRFGRAVYLKEIEASRARYERARQAGHDKALVFPDWVHPTADDRAIVYHKGAYVLHLLRDAAGRAAFLGRPARLYADVHGQVGHDGRFSAGDGARAAAPI